MQQKYTSIDLWYALVVENSQDKWLIENMYAALAQEPPHILSVVAERTCNLQCKHCIFQAETSSDKMSHCSDLDVVVLHIAQQMPEGACLVHEGRIFRPQHLAWLLAVRKARPDIKIGMIDNGSYLVHDRSLHTSGFAFDWLDISLDGPEQIHNLQRGNAKSYAQAMRGIAEAQTYLQPNGRVHSLFTVTKLNYASILATENALPHQVGEWHVTTLTPARPKIALFALNQHEFNIAWQQIVAANTLRPIHFRIYVAEDIAKLAQVVGKARFCSAVEQAIVAPGAIQFVLEGVEVTFYPQSVSPTETFVIDADATYRAPYAIAFTLTELQRGTSRFGQNVRPYTNAQIHSGSSFRVLYQNGVQNWQMHFGVQALVKEKHIFSSILA
ncbi:MAG: radical SAM protein [Patescibacteria group bacterium]|jgi:hypothetical protein